MKLLNVTGGATKFIQLVIAISETLKAGYKPTDITVKSSSALAIIPILLGLEQEMYQEGINLKLEKYFKIPPTDGNGSFTKKALFRAAWSFLPNWIPGGDVNSFGVQDTRPLLKKYLTEELFNAYKNNDNYPNVHVVSFMPTSAKICVTNLKQCNYLYAIDIISGSSKIQAITDSINIGGVDHVDGGMYLAGSGGYLMETGYFDKVEQCVSIYSWTDPHFDILPSDGWKENIANNSARIVQNLKGSNKWFCPNHEKWYCFANGVERLPIHVPDVFKYTYEYKQETVEKAVSLTQLYMKDVLSNTKFKIKDD